MRGLNQEKLIKLQLDNNTYFDFDLESKYVLFYGSNRIGKTQISKAMKNYFEDNEMTVLLFDEDILQGMLLPEETNKKSFSVMPKNQEYSYYRRKRDEVAKFLDVKDNIKKLCGVNTKTRLSFLPKIADYISTNVYNNDSKKEIFYNDTIIKELITPSIEGIKNIKEILDSIRNGELSNFNNPVNIDNVIEIDIFNIQKK